MLLSKDKYFTIIKELICGHPQVGRYDVSIIYIGEYVYCCLYFILHDQFYLEQRDYLLLRNL